MKKKGRQKYYYDRNAKSLPVLKLGDQVIFKKTGKEWHYGKIVGIVNDRSYIVRDTFENHFRRNRRFIAKTTNCDFNASDLLYEENVKCKSGENMPEINIVPPDDNVNRTNTNVNAENHEPVCNVDESLPLAAGDDFNSSDEYATADSSDSETGFDSDVATAVPVGNFKTTRSGRVIRPPQRYGFD